DGRQRQPLREDPHVQLQGEPRHRSPHQPDAPQARSRDGGGSRRARLGVDQRRACGSPQRRRSRHELTVIEVLKAASGHLQKHRSDSARLDAEVLLAQALGMRRLDLYLQFDPPLTEDELTRYRGLIQQRAHGDPVAYLVGHKEFMALDFEVTPAVLVPNPDTEVLVQRAVAIAREAAGGVRAADIGTGSGCIAVALAHYAPEAEVWASDVSREALDVAARNVVRHGLGERVHIVCGDLMEPAPDELDMVCANLPYIE